MIRPMIYVCFFEILLVYTAAIPKVREHNQQDTVVESSEGSKLHGRKLDAYLEKPDSEDYYKNYHKYDKHVHILGGYKEEQQPAVTSFEGYKSPGGKLGGKLDAYFDKPDGEDYDESYHKYDKHVHILGGYKEEQKPAVTSFEGYKSPGGKLGGKLDAYFDKPDGEDYGESYHKYDKHVHILGGYKEEQNPAVTSFEGYKSPGGKLGGKLDAYFNKPNGEDYDESYHKYDKHVDIQGERGGQENTVRSFEGSKFLSGKLDAYLDKPDSEDYHKNYHKYGEHVDIQGEFGGKENDVSSFEGSKFSAGKLDAYLDKPDGEDYHENYHKYDEHVDIQGSYKGEKKSVVGSPESYKLFGGNLDAYLEKLDGKVGPLWNSQRAHNLTVGYKTYQERLLFSANINKPSKTWRFVTENVMVESSHGEHISFIEAYDLHTNHGDAGYASIISGGPGSKSVTIHLKSARNHGLKYYVRVFGHY